MIRILFMTIIVLTASATGTAMSKDDIIVYWLDRFGNGLYDLNQPFFPFLRSHEYALSFPEMKNPSPEHFLSFLRATNETFDCWAKASGNTTASSRDLTFDTKIVERKSIAGVLMRRIPIINNFDYDKSKYEDEDPKYICWETPGSHYDYLGLIQIRLLIMLFSSKDYRFQEEAEELLGYITHPPDPQQRYEKKDQEAFFCYTGNSRRELPNFLKAYIAACKGKGQGF